MQTAFNSFNRKLHIHLGLCLLFFIWCFSLSGLILNHGWKFASFWEERKESMVDFTIPPAALDRTVAEASVLKYLGIRGELQDRKRVDELLEFRVVSPGRVSDIHVDLNSGMGTLKILQYNFWGKLRTLHTFNGLNKEIPSQSPHWLMTNVWRFTMDAIALGLITICLTSWMMWFKIRKEYKLGYIFVFAGFAIAFYFIF